MDPSDPFKGLFIAISELLLPSRLATESLKCVILQGLLSRKGVQVVADDGLAASNGPELGPLEPSMGLVFHLQCCGSLVVVNWLELRPRGLLSAGRG